MIKEWITKKLLERQLKNIPEAQREMIMKLVEKNPELFTKISKEIEAETKRGTGQMKAMIDVMKRHQSALRDVFASSGIDPKDLPRP
jgi:hypothetical protein